MSFSFRLLRKEGGEGGKGEVTNGRGRGGACLFPFVLFCVPVLLLHTVVFIYVCGGGQKRRGKGHTGRTVQCVCLF